MDIILRPPCAAKQRFKIHIFFSGGSGSMSELLTADGGRQSSVRKRHGSVRPKGCDESEGRSTMSGAGTSDQPLPVLDDRDGLLDKGGVMFVTASALCICGSLGLGYWAMQMRDLWDMEPLLALPQLIAALLVAGLGLSGLVLLAIQPAQPTSESPDPGRELSNEQMRTDLSLEELLAVTHDYGAPLPGGVSVRAEYCKPDIQEHIVGQVGPVCAAASVSSALNVLNGLSAKSKDKFRVR